MKRILVVGSSGALGRTVLRTLKQRLGSTGCETTSIDFSNSNCADINLLLDGKQAWGLQMKGIQETIDMEPSPQFDAIIHVAGGFIPGGLGSGVEHVEKSLSTNLFSAFTAAELASKYLAESGLLTLTGAQGAFDQGCSFAIGYGMSKAATHSLAMSIHSDPSQLPSKSRVVCILPQTIDTAANREAMPGKLWSIHPSLLFIKISLTTRNGPFPLD